MTFKVPSFLIWFVGFLCSPWAFGQQNRVVAGHESFDDLCADHTVAASLQTTLHTLLETAKMDSCSGAFSKITQMLQGAPWSGVLELHSKVGDLSPLLFFNTSHM